ncbi:helix-turn-helix transcriptional regulator [Actinoallomurus purpureus]|uniref:helix-turn-helix domain-containing protein n=1 Tax=Actinoallomurus purpureus TaxID=478114 RepID=UPI0020926F7F|nr:helix-turn-helix transcriptional regulator [Actinoallomurus purpureus]MCO6006547.1 helix-turn-helix transcriptional regulator [Actinoallomurus purpureus]
MDTEWMRTMPKPPKVLMPNQSLTAYFGFEVRKHREGAKLSQTELADRLHWAKSTVGNLETAFRSPTVDHATDLDRFFTTDRFGWLHGLIVREELPDFFRPFARREPNATNIRMFEPLVIPGLLQIEEYARAVMAEGRAPEELEQAVAARMDRQKILDRREPPPPRLWVVLDRGVIRRQVGGPETMRKQLTHLIEAAERYNVTIQVVPESVGGYVGLEGGFSILSFDEGADIAYAGASGGGHMIEQQKDVARTGTRFELIRARALSADASVQLIREAL